MGGWNAWDHFDNSGLRLMWATLPYVAGAYLPDHSMVILNPDRTRVEQDCALAEELGHYELGHEPVDDPVERARVELRARRWAALRLIDAEQIIEAAQWSPFLDEVADMLEVDPDLVVARIDLMTDEERRRLDETLAREGGM